MKKILFLLLICFIKLNAYELEIMKANSSNAYWRYILFIDENGELKQKRLNIDGEVVYYDTEYYMFYPYKSIKFNESGTQYKWISLEDYKEFEKNNPSFINDQYLQYTQAYLNFLYNDKLFNQDTYVKYENYQILYNEDGLAVESIVGGVWKGLYDTPENSGLLYDRQNNILYDNGNVASLFQRFWFSLTGNVSKTLKVYYISMLGLNVFILIVAVYLVKVLLGLIIKWITTVINNTKVNVNLGAQKRW